jgi:hypothetical protein
MSMSPGNPTHFSLAAIRPSRQILFMANSFFLIVLAFASGYNFKGYTVRRDMAASMAESARYLESIRANYDAANAILRELDLSYQTRFETRIDPGLIPSATPMEAPAATSPMGATAPPSFEPVIDVRPETIHPPAPTVPSPAVPAIPAIQPKKPDPALPYGHVRHRIMPGEILSALVPKREMPYFLYENPMITDPDQIFPGQSILIRVPDTHIRRGTYMNRYFIRPADPLSPEGGLRLVEWLNIPENQGVVGFLVQENKPVIGPSTVPFVDLSRTAPVLLDRRLGGDRGAVNIRSRVRRISAAHGPMLFKTDTLKPSVFKTPYRGIRETKTPDIAVHLRAMTGSLSDYYAAQAGKSADRELYHFFIFGDTVVQAACLGPEHFEDVADKPRIRIGLGYTNASTPRTLAVLQQSLGICRVHRGEMVQVNPKTLSGFLRRP